jgi:hypothetical protein
LVFFKEEVATIVGQEVDPISWNKNVGGDCGGGRFLSSHAKAIPETRTVGAVGFHVFNTEPINRSFNYSKRCLIIN